MKYIFISTLCLFFGACQQNKPHSSNEGSADPHSYSNPQQAVVKHLDLDLKVDFESHILSGRAEWTIENGTNSDTIIFDTRGLKIEKVVLGEDVKETSFTLGKEDKFLGQPLKVHIKPSSTKVTIWYKTSEEAAALQWLTPAQTAGKKHPFLFTQSQAILARTWIPCQDSPGIRFTYNAVVTVPHELMAVMSAENSQKLRTDGVYHFKQVHAIPSYLMALAVGDLQFQKTDERTGVYAEPVTLPKAAWEFAEMGKMVNAAEKLYGPYRWGRYDVLVLPPSFPFGGMENPMLTFATPTVIAGDRSLVSLIAHELAHSWSGNLVTNATWNDFWLNEGFTTYFERRIVEAVYGREEAEMQEVLGFQALKESIGESGDDTKLKGNFAGRDPDEGMTDIAYEKGYFFLKTIERAAGREAFDKFLKGYFDQHAFKSVTTEEFVKYLESNLLAKNAGLSDKIGVSGWIYQTGLPSNIAPVNSGKFNAIDSLVARWKATNKTAGLKDRIKTTNELLYFIKALPENLSASQMALIDKELAITKSGNAEIQCAWYTLAVRHQYKPAYARTEEFLVNVGRRKFLLPLYKEMAATPEGKAWAIQIYKKARPNYHSVSYNTIDQILK